eukprot:15452796-Alexandrium_andersonii.AAC.1
MRPLLRLFVGPRSSGFERLKRFQHVQLTLALLGSIRLIRWLLTYQQPRIARIVDWRIADWSARFRYVAASGPVKARC